jgi:two-component system, OmpR family, phosphate regulon sensor histidine kinase PhoR
MSRRWKNSLVARFFLSYLVIVFLLFATFFLYSGAAVKSFYITLLSRKMEQEARLLDRILPVDAAGEALDTISRNLAGELGVRITVIAPDGRVLGDSGEPSAMMENHANRPEVVDAQAQGSGTSARFSTTVGDTMLYRAVRESHSGNPRIIRVSVPLEDIDAVIASLRRTLLLGLLLLCGAGLAFAFLFSRRIGQRVKRPAEFSQRVSGGLHPQDFFPEKGDDELSLLEHNLKEMSRRIREKMREILTEKEKVDSILRGMIEGLLVVDTKGRILLVNQPAERMFRLPSAPSLQGASFMEVSRHPEMKKLIEEVLVCDCSRECFSKEVGLEEGRWFRVNAVSLRDGEEKPLGFILVFHDITEIRRLETVRTDFVANVSHELRTPLTAIRGYVETLRRSPPADRKDADHFLEIIERHAERLARLTDDLLTLSDLESGRAKLATAPLDVGELFRRVNEIFEDRAAKKGLHISRAVAPDAPFVVGDPDRLQQLLINLLDNAVKFTPSGGRVRMSASRVFGATADGKPMVEITVSDSGCGVAENDLPRLTERFYRVDKARSRELGGTGLGLAIVKYIIQAHDGRLQIESRPQQGTTVRVILPGAVARPVPNGVLFLCIANSCRSQMAEGFARAVAPPDTNIYSAGTAPGRVHPLAIQVMEEVGIDISGQRSKGIEETPLESIDLVVTLCGEVAESCPAFPKNTRRHHWPLLDPALVKGKEQEVLKRFREVRDEIRARVNDLFAA